MIIDLTHTITPEMPMYPGSAAPSIKPTGSLTRDGFRETQLTIASHTGTHMDAPSHMLPRALRWRCCPPPSSAAGPWCWTYRTCRPERHHRRLPPGAERDHPLGGFRAVLHRLGAEVGHRRLL